MRSLSLALVTLIFAAVLLPPGASGAEPSSREMIAYCKRMLASDAEFSSMVQVRRASMSSTRFSGTSHSDPEVELVAVDRTGGEWLVFCQFDRHYPITAKLFAKMPDFCDCVVSFADPEQLSELNRSAASRTP